MPGARSGPGRVGYGLVTVVLAGILTGCSDGGTPTTAGGTASTTVSPGGNAGPATTQPSVGGKATPPVEVAIQLDGRSISPRTPFGATVSWTPLVAAAAARTRVDVIGPLTAQGGAGQWKDVAAGHTLAASAQVTVSGDGPGEVRATAELLDAGGAILFGRTTVLYVLATGPDVLTGTTGTLDLRLRQLDVDRAAGRVSAADYARLRDRILGGGALETRD